MNERFKTDKTNDLCCGSNFVIFWIVIKPTEIGDYSSCIGYAISGVTILLCVRKNTLALYTVESSAVIEKQYTGIISYVYKNQPGTKPIEISVKQSWLSVSIKTKTDINSSRSITGTIVSEYGDDVLYYNYITNPDAVTQGKNPIQYGTCRMVLTEIIHTKENIGLQQNRWRYGMEGSQ